MKSQKISYDDYAFFITQTANLVKTDLPIVPGLKNVARDIKNKTLKTTVADIAGEIESGKSLSDACLKHPGLFPPFYVSMIKAGEISGNLGEILNNLAVYSGKINRFRKKIKEVMIYPAIVFAAAVMVSAFIFSLLLPALRELMESAPQNYRAPGALSFSIFLGSHWAAILVLFITACAVFASILSRDKTLLEKISFNTPCYGRILQYASISRFSRNLANLLSSRVPFKEAVKLAGATSGSLEIESAAGEICREIESGGDWCGVFEKYPVFPGTYIWMIKTGEKNGELENLLLSTADFYEDAFDRQVHVFIHFIEPLIILFLGLLIAIITIILLKSLLGGIQAMGLFLS